MPAVWPLFHLLRIWARYPVPTMNFLSCTTGQSIGNHVMLVIGCLCRRMTYVVGLDMLSAAECM